MLSDIHNKKNKLKTKQNSLSLLLTTVTIVIFRYCDSVRVSSTTMSVLALFWISLKLNHHPKPQTISLLYLWLFSGQRDMSEDTRI